MLGNDLPSAASRALKVIADWRAASRLNAFRDRFVFGSIINRGGSQFDPNLRDSDIDIVHLLSSDLNAIDRAKTIDQLQEEVRLLEVSLVRAFRLGRADRAVTSHLVLTPTEAKYDVHKDGKRRLLTEEKFARIPYATGDPLVTISPTDQDSEFYSINLEALQVVEWVQGVRNQFLSTALNDERMLKPVAFVQGGDPLPKAAMRSAALLAWIDAPSSDITDRENVARGLDFISEKVLPQQHDAAALDLKDKVSLRRSARGVPEALFPFDQLLLAELLFDAATSRFRSTFREGLKSFASETLGKIRTQAGPKT
jgi:hypothetical protein